MTDIILWIVALFAGYVCGRVSVKNEPTKQQDQELNKRMVEDIAYYKKLTRELSEENRELRRKLNVAK